MKITENKKHELIIIILCLCILLPLVTAGFFNRPASDDYSYSLITGTVAQNGGNVFDILKAAWETNMQYYQQWQGLYTSAFLLALQPGIFGEQFYMFAFLIVMLCTYLPLFGSVHILNRQYFKNSAVFSLALSLAVYTMLVVWLPDINDGMYWFNGAMNYTPWAFTNIFNLCLLLKIGTENKKNKRILFIAASTLLAFITSGGNHVTAFANILLLLSALLFAVSKKKLFPVFPFAAACIGFIIMYAAPGTAVRQTFFESPGVVTTVVKTALHVHGLASQWFSIKWLLSLIVLTPFALEFGYKNKDKFSSRFLLHLFAMLIVSAAVICGMFCVPYYAMGGFGMGRVTNVIWITFNFLSWFIWFMLVGWLVAKDFINIEKITEIKHIQLIRFLSVAVGLCLTVIIFENSVACWSVKAASELAKGIPQGYAYEMDERIALYHDDSLTSVKVDPIKHRSELLYSADVGTDPSVWPNNVLVSYYGKEITLNK